MNKQPQKSKSPSTGQNDGLPCAPDAERVLLGAIMVNKDCLDEVVVFLKPSDFHSDMHRKIFAGMLRLHKTNSGIDIVTLSADLTSKKELEAVGGVAYLSSLMDGVPHLPSALEYAKAILDASRRRAIINASQNAISRAMDGSEKAEAILEATEQAILGLHDADPEQPFIHVQEAVPDALRQIYEQSKWDKPFGYATGIPGLEEYINSYRPGETYLIGGETAHGKSSAAIQCICENAVKGEVPVLFLTAEMDNYAVILRMIAGTNGIPHDRLRDPRYLSKEQRAILHEIWEEKPYSKYPIFLDDSSRLTVESVTSKIRLAIKRHKIKMVFLDYIQLVAGQGQSKTEQIEDVGRRLREMAKDEGLAMVVLSQLSRKDAKRKNKLPALDDVRWSGSLAQDAHAVLFTYRPQNNEGKFSKNDLIIVAKQRSGAIGRVKVEYEYDTLMFKSRSNEFVEPGKEDK